MFEIFHETQPGDTAKIFSELKTKHPDAHHVILRLTPDADAWTWLETLHHDLEGALRGMRFLAQKASASLDAEDPKGQRTLASIARHLETIENLKRTLVDRLFPLDIGAPKP